MNFKSTVLMSGRFKTQVIQNGKVVRDNPWAGNQITDNGLNLLSTNLICELFESCHVGTGIPVLKESGGTVRLSQELGTYNVVASVPFFDGTDHGNSRIKWDSGEEAKITAVPDNTGFNATTNIDQEVAEGQFSLHYVNVDTITTHDKIHSSYASTGNGTTLSGNVLTFARAYDFAAETGNKIITEIGLNEFQAAGQNLFARHKLEKSVTLVSGQSIRVLYELKLTLNQITPETRAMSSIGYIPRTNSLNGVELWQTLHLSAVSSTGLTTDTGTEGLGGTAGSTLMEPSTADGASGPFVFLSSDSQAHNAFGVNGPDRSIGTTYIELQSVSESVFINTFNVARNAMFDINDGNATDIRSIGVGSSATGDAGDAGNQTIVFLFDSVQAKTNDEAVTYSFLTEWTRQLIN